MNDRQACDRSQPRRASSRMNPLLTNEDSERLFFLVANENRVSRASETRVTDGVASLVEISCIAASPASHDGNKYPSTSRFSGTRWTCTVTSVMTPNRPSLPRIISRTLGPVEVDGSGRSTNGPPGRTTRRPRVMSAMSPYLSDCIPDERVATQPPSVECVKLSGKCPNVQPCPFNCSSTDGPDTPARSE